MTIKRYLALLKSLHGVSVTRRQTRGLDAAPASVKTALTGHLRQVRAYFRAPRAKRAAMTLSLPLMRGELLALGFTQMDTPDGRLQWVHPLGDDTGELILAGLLAPPRATSRTEQVMEDIQAGHQPPVENPRPVPVPGKPGTYTYSIKKGQRITRLPRR